MLSHVMKISLNDKPRFRIGRSAAIDENDFTIDGMGMQASHTAHHCRGLCLCSRHLASSILPFPPSLPPYSSLLC